MKTRNSKMRKKSKNTVDVYFVVISIVVAMILAMILLPTCADLIDAEKELFECANTPTQTIFVLDVRSMCGRIIQYQEAKEEELERKETLCRNYRILTGICLVLFVCASETSYRHLVRIITRRHEDGDY